MMISALAVGRKIVGVRMGGGGGVGWSVLIANALSVRWYDSFICRFAWGGQGRGCVLRLVSSARLRALLLFVFVFFCFFFPVASSGAALSPI